MSEQTVTLAARDAAKIARYVRAFRNADRRHDCNDLLNAACRLAYLVENVSSAEDWHKLPGAYDV